MKRLVLALLLPLLSFACEGPIDEMPLSAAAVEGTTQMIVTHLGPEPRTAAHLLPVASPNVKISQQDWDALRAGTRAPQSKREREALGMVIIACANNEWCDVNDCNGTDVDTILPDGFDQKEYQIAPDANYGSGFDNCDNTQGPGVPLPPFRCNWSGGGGRVYSGCWGPPCATIPTLTAGDVYLFADGTYGGLCAHRNITSQLLIPDMHSIATGNAFFNTLSSFRWGGPNGSASEWFSMWGKKNYSSLSNSFFINYATEWATMPNQIWEIGNDNAESMKAGYPGP